jgi:hypothetical protein
MRCDDIDDMTLKCHVRRQDTLQLIKGKAHPGPWPLAQHSGFTTSKQVQWAGTGGGSSRQQQQTAGERRKQHKKEKQKRIFHVRNVLEHEDGSEGRDCRGGRLNRYQVVASRAHIKMRTWKTQRQIWRQRIIQKGKQIREAENWSQSALKKIRTEIVARRKLKRSRGWKKNWENQSSEENQIEIFLYLWFNVENSFLQIDSRFHKKMKFEETVLTADGVAQLFF